MSKLRIILLHLCLVAVCLHCGHTAFAQSTFGQPTPAGAQKKDTSMNKSNSKKWKDNAARVYYKKLNSEKKYTPDSSLHTFHRRPFIQPWSRDMGNLGSPVNNMFFTPEDRMGPTLGYHVYDAYRFFADSLKFYNTTRPYAAFTYQLGSKLEQMAAISYTQNIKPNWNFAVDYRKITAPGFYTAQRNNHDNASLSTNYQSKNLRYQLYGAVVYNKEQHDENGGINDSLLTDPTYSNKKTITTAFQNNVYSLTRSPVVNNLRDFEIMLQHSYTFGRVDTNYNKDSTEYSTKLIPRFSITHKFQLGDEKHLYKDFTPDSARYSSLFSKPFLFNNGGYPGIDSVFSQQKWFWVDNRILLNGFIGKDDRHLQFSAGAGNRIDDFTTDYATGLNKDNIVSNYLIGDIHKEALAPGQWYYNAGGQFFVTGAAAGDFDLHADLGKTLKNNWAGFLIGFQQKLNSSPYAYNFYGDQYVQLSKSFDKENVTRIYATLESPRLRLSLGLSNYLISNYIYINTQELPDQYSPAFNLTQLWLRKEFRFGKFILDNELAYQQLPSGAPLNIPALLGKHQLSIESNLFKKALKVATGIEVRYNTGYYAPGYDPLLNRFYYQNTTTISNTPEGSVFFNFRIKSFRAFFMADQVQQLFTRNVINFPGYPSQDFMIRFGFTWVMVN